MQQNGNPQSSGSASIRPRVEPVYIRFVGDSVGVVNLTPGALQLMADQVTNTLMQTISVAKMCTLHGRRLTLSGDDIEFALKHLKLHVPMGAGCRRAPQFRQVAMQNNEELFVKEDFDLDLTAVSEEPMPKVPIKPYIRAHWLALEGKLAMVPENIRTAKVDEADDLRDGAEEVKAASISMRRETAGGPSGASVSFRAASRQVDTKEHIQIKPPVVESLSVEQQMYIKEVVEAIVGMNDDLRQSALCSLEVDTGLQPILPKFSRLIYTAIRCNVLHRCLSMLIYLVRIIRALSINQSIKLVGVLHELVPSLLSCMIGRSLCSRPEADNHWALRDFAVKTLMQILKDDSVAETRRRALRALRKVWDDRNSSYAMIYGCVAPIIEWTDESDRPEMLQRFQELVAETNPQNQGSMSTLQRIEAHKLYNHLMKHEQTLRRS